MALQLNLQPIKKKITALVFINNWYIAHTTASQLYVTETLKILKKNRHMKLEI